MKENYSGPRRWAFVVIAGGTLFSLPFVHKTEPDANSSSQALSQPDIIVPIPDKPVIAELPPISELIRSQDVIPSLTGDLAPGLVQTHELSNQQSNQERNGERHRPIQQPRRVSTEKVVDSPAMQVDTVVSLPRDESVESNALPEWANANRSKLDELIEHSPRPSEFVPEKTMPLQPLRPWIAGPSSYSASNTFESHSSQGTTNSSAAAAMSGPARQSALVSTSALPSTTDKLVAPTASPWSTDSAEQPGGGSKQPGDGTTNQLATGRPLATHSVRVDAWPHEELTAEQRAKFVTAPRPQARELVSAIVPPDQVLHRTNESGSEMVSVKRPVLTRSPANVPASSHAERPQVTITSGQPAGDKSNRVIFQPR